MKRFFSTAGPVNPGKHYYIDSLTRIDLDRLMSLVHQEKYFVLHAPRQTGKTTLLRSFMSHLNKDGRYTCLHVNVEKAQAARENVNKAYPLRSKSVPFAFQSVPKAFRSVPPFFRRGTGTVTGNGLGNEYIGTFVFNCS